MAGGDCWNLLNVCMCMGLLNEPSSGPSAGTSGEPWCECDNY